MCLNNTWFYNCNSLDNIVTYDSELLNLNVEQTLDLGLYEDFPGTIDYLAEKCASPAQIIRQIISPFYTKTDISIYWNPVIEKAGMYVRPKLNQKEFDWGCQLLSEKLGKDQVHFKPLSPNDLQDWWVKVAYSPTLRRLGELAQFFPSKDIPGFGGRPIAAMIASGLLGTGLGYGAGYLSEKILPEYAQTKGTLRNRLALLGGAGGALIGSMPGLVNLHEGRRFNDPTLFEGFPEDGFEDKLPTSKKYKEAVENFIAKKANNSLGTIGGPSFTEMPLIRTNELGQVLWGTNASPQTTAMTMGAVYGAGQMPDPNSRPGMVTPHQVGLFGMAMGAAGGGIKGYITGRTVGFGLGLLTGMPNSTQNTLGQTGATLGVISSIVPRLFN